MQENIKENTLLKSVIELPFEFRNWLAKRLLGDYSFIGIQRKMFSKNLEKHYCYKNFDEFDFSLTELFYRTSGPDASSLNSLKIVESIKENNFFTCFLISLFADIRDPSDQDKYALPNFFLDGLILVNQGYLSKEEFWKRCEAVNLKVGYKNTHSFKNKRSFSYSILELKNDSKDYKSASFKNTEALLFQCIDYFLVNKKKEIAFLMNFNKNNFFNYIDKNVENSSNNELKVSWKDQDLCRELYKEEIISAWKNEGAFFEIFNDNDKNSGRNIKNKSENERKRLAKAIWLDEDKYAEYSEIFKQNSSFVDYKEDEEITDYLKKTFESLQSMSEKELNICRIYEEKVTNINYLIQQNLGDKTKSDFIFFSIISLLIILSVTLLLNKLFNKLSKSKEAD